MNSNNSQEKIYKLFVDFAGQYARLSPYEELNEKEPEPVKFIWNNWGADDKKIADFIPTFFHCVVKENIADLLEENFTGIQKKSIKIVDLVTDEKKKKRLKWYPLNVPELALLEVTKRVSILPISTMEVLEEEDNGKIRKILKDVTGIAELEDGVIIPREKGKGFFISREEINNFDFFHPEDTSFCLCTEKVKLFVENAGYTNVYFLEAGEIVDE